MSIANDIEKMLNSGASAVDVIDGLLCDGKIRTAADAFEAEVTLDLAKENTRECDRENGFVHLHGQHEGPLESEWEKVHGELRQLMHDKANR